MARLAIAALIVALAAGGCGRDADMGARRQAGGLDWGGGGGETVDSDLPDPEVAFLGEITAPTMRGPYGIAVGPEGVIAVADTGAQLAHLFSPRGRPLMTLSAPGAMGIAVDGQGRVFVGDRRGGSVRIFDAVGAPAGFLGGAEGALTRPADLAWDPTGNAIWVTDAGANLVRVYAADTGLPLFSFGGYGTTVGTFNNPTGIVVDDAAGRVYVTDHGNSRIQVFDRTGAYLDKFGSYGSDKKELNRPGGLAIDALERLYVTDAFQSTLQVLDSGGLHVSYLGEPGTLYGQIRLSGDAVLDPFNRLWVTSYKTGKILVYGLDDWTEPPPEIVPLAADVAVAPATLTALAHAPWVTAYIEVPDGDVYDIDADSVLLQGLPRDPGTPATVGDHDADGVPDLALKFVYADLLAALGTAGPHDVTLVGAFGGGGSFEGTATVSVLDMTATSRERGGPPHSPGPPDAPGGPR